MRILVCSLEAPLPPMNGFRLHLIPLLRELRRDHDVRLVGFRYPDQDPAAEPDVPSRLFPRPSTRLPGKARELPRSLMTGRPLGVDRLADRLSQSVRQELSTFDPDVVHVTTSELALLSDELIQRPSVIVPGDAWFLNVESDVRLATGLRRTLLRRQLEWVRRFESEQYPRFGATIVFTDGDRDALLEMNSGLRVHAIPNGVDTVAFAPPPDAQRDPDRIVFTGVMRYAPNVSAAEFLARSVFPLVREARPTARLALVGRNPERRVQALGVIDGVEVTGAVPDIRPWLTGSAVYACPMVSGTGIKNKLLEAMACGLPCVATPLGAQGLRVTDGREVLIGSTERELAAGILRLLDEPDHAASMGRAARAYVEAEHTWPGAARRFEAVYREVVAAARAG
jgi:glycosyltransferase involved in cell wall biosynthesis